MGFFFAHNAAHLARCKRTAETGRTEAGRRQFRTIALCRCACVGSGAGPRLRRPFVVCRATQRHQIVQRVQLRQVHCHFEDAASQFNSPPVQVWHIMLRFRFEHFEFRGVGAFWLVSPPIQTFQKPVQLHCRAHNGCVASIASDCETRVLYAMYSGISQQLAMLGPLMRRQKAVRAHVPERAQRRAIRRLRTPQRRMHVRPDGTPQTNT